MPASITGDTLDDGVRALGERLGTRLGEIFVETAQSNASRRTGQMADETRADAPEIHGDTISVHAECHVDHGIYQDRGTGIYGPEGQPITPKTARVLRFDWPAAGGIVFATFVRGSEPTRWWTKAVEAWHQIVRRVEAGG